MEIAAISSFLSAPSTVASMALAGTGISAYGSYQQGRAQAAMGKYAQRGAELQARQAYLDEIANRDIMARQRRARIGSMASQIAASGVSFSGTPLFLLEEAQSAMLTEASRVSQQSAAQQAQLIQSGGIARAEGLLAKQAGYAQAGGGLLSGIGSTMQSYTTAKKEPTIKNVTINLGDGR